MFLFKNVRNTGHLTISDAISDFVAGKNVMAKEKPATFQCLMKVPFCIIRGLRTAIWLH